jgi:hypothetical protein
VAGMVGGQGRFFLIDWAVTSLLIGCLTVLRSWHGRQRVEAIGRLAQ